MYPHPSPPDRQRGQYLYVRVNSTKFSGQSGNRIGIIGRGLPEHTLVFAHCPLTSHTPVSWFFFKALLSPDPSPPILNHVEGEGVLAPRAGAFSTRCALAVRRPLPPYIFRPPPAPRSARWTTTQPASWRAPKAPRVPGPVSFPKPYPPPLGAGTLPACRSPGGSPTWRTPSTSPSSTCSSSPTRPASATWRVCRPPSPIPPIRSPKATSHFAGVSLQLNMLAGGLGPHLLETDLVVVSHVCRIAGGNS